MRCNVKRKCIYYKRISDPEHGMTYVGDKRTFLFPAQAGITHILANTSMRIKNDLLEQKVVFVRKRQLLFTFYVCSADKVLRVVVALVIFGKVAAVSKREGVICLKVEVHEFVICLGGHARLLGGLAVTV